jgi:methylenetetrahydrofolate dehydrogenase (NADP+)/methenyltetrahydrofolate cyclohydrolase
MVLGLPGVRAVARRTGVLEILRRAGVPLAGSRPSSWFGRRPDRGRPLSILLSQKGVDATVTLCHTRTRTSALHARSGRRWSWPRAGRGR